MTGGREEAFPGVLESLGLVSAPGACYLLWLRSDPFASFLSLRLGGPIRPMSVKCFEVSPAKHLQMHHLSTGRRDQLGWGQGRTVGGGEVESSRTALLAESFPSLPLPALAQLQAQEASPL